MTVTPKKLGLAALLLLLAAPALLAGCAGDVGDPAGDGNLPPGDGVPTDEPPAGEGPATSTGKLTVEAFREFDVVRQYNYRHPRFRGVSTRRSVSQRVVVFIPDHVRGREDRVPVLALLGGAHAFGEAELLGASGTPRFFQTQAVYVAIEHRGYGRSLSDDADQSIPNYVSYDEAVEDAYAVIQDLKMEYRGPWAVVGHHYAGSLAVELGARHPGAAAVFGASSAPLRWDAVNESHEGYVAEVLGQAGFDRARGFMKGLTSRVTFDRAWRTREVFESYLHELSTSTQAAILHWHLSPLMDLSADDAADKLGVIAEAAPQVASLTSAAALLGVEKVSRAQMLTGDWSARTWRYQQCAELGGFLASPTGDGVFLRSAAEHARECGFTFGKANVMGLERGDVTWSLEENLSRFGATNTRGAAAPKLVLLQGGRDPWLEQGARTPNWKARTEHERYRLYDTHYGVYVEAPAGAHTPDREDPMVSLAFWGEIVRIAREHKAALPNAEENGSTPQ